jgi:hypothetical protein
MRGRDKPPLDASEAVALTTALARLAWACDPISGVTNINGRAIGNEQGDLVLRRACAGERNGLVRYRVTRNAAAANVVPGRARRCLHRAR